MLDARLLTRLTEKKAKLDVLDPLPAAIVRRLNEQLAVEWIYNSNATYGNTLTLRETRLILETGMTIGGKSLREHFEVINHQKAINYVYSLVNDEVPLTAFHVRQLHHLVLANIDDEGACHRAQLNTLPRSEYTTHLAPKQPRQMDSFTERGTTRLRKP